MANNKPIWKKFKFWLPIVTGFVGALAVVSEILLGIELPNEVVSSIVAIVLMILSAILGVDWSEKDI